MRNPDRASELATAGVEPVGGDLADSRALARLTGDCDAVVHCAGAVRGASYRDFARTNIDGFENLLDALRGREGPVRLLLLSSLAARHPELSWYAESKFEAEQLLRRRDEAPSWVILRPSAVYGPGDREMRAVFRWMARGIAWVPGDPAARYSLLHVDDLAEACIATLAGKAAGLTLEVGDGRPGGYDWAEMAAIAGERWQRRVRLLRLPRPVPDGIALLNLSLSRLSRRAPMLTPPKLRELRHPDWVADNAEIERHTGWKPALDLRKGLQHLVS